MSKVILCIILLLMGPKLWANNKYQKLRHVIKNDSLLNSSKYFIIISRMQCGGCVDEKLNNFIHQATKQQKKETLFILDTTNRAFPFIKKNFRYIYVSQDTLEKYYPLISNYILIVKKGKVITFQKEFDTLLSDPDIIKYYQSDISSAVERK